GGGKRSGGWMGRPIPYPQREGVGGNGRLRLHPIVPSGGVGVNYLAFPPSRTGRFVGRKAADC
ncbi:MAG: hypothetical protein ABR915_21380, partial [Thermoguttaceae bacterium]